MKTLDDVKDAMSSLYEELKSGKLERVQASELANIAGKWLKAEQLKLAREIFEDAIQQRIPRLPVRPPGKRQGRRGRTYNHKTTIA